MKTHKLKRIGFLSIFCVMVMGLALCFAGQTSADSGKPDYRLQVSPLQLSIGTLEPGETYTGSFEVQNTGNKAYPYTTEIAPYSVSGLDYAQDFNTPTSHTIMTGWIEITSGATGTVEPNSFEVVKYVIHVPDDAPAGTQSAAIMTTMDLSKDVDASAIQTVSRIAYYFYANVAGETRTTGEILENKIPGFIFNPPIVATSVVKNTGNVYTEARYELEIHEFFGDKLAYTNVTEDRNGDKVYDTAIIFPETERYNEVSWEGAPQLGIFKVKQTITIFDEVSTVEKVVFLCPMWFLVIVLIFVFVAIFWVVSRFTGRKKA